MTSQEKELLTALQNAGADASVAEIIRRNDWAPTPKTRKTLSSQLCKLRDKGLVAAYQENGINYWRLLTKGLAALTGDNSPDIPAPEPVLESSPIQPIEPDISANIPAPEQPVPGPYFPDQWDDEPDGLDKINPALSLVQESIRLPRLVTPFYDLQDALFVLDTMATVCCHGMPAYQAEITRIAEHLKATAA